jgi:hypothetical protein
MHAISPSSVVTSVFVVLPQTSKLKENCNECNNTKLGPEVTAAESYYLAWSRVYCSVVNEES